MLQDVAKAVGLIPLELEALLEVRDALYEEQITFFDMRHGCFCISGHMGKRLGMNNESKHDESYTEQVGKLPVANRMRQLCYPPQPRGATERSHGYLASQVEAAQAIDRMLAGGDPWPPTS